MKEEIETFSCSLITVEIKGLYWRIAEQSLRGDAFNRQAADTMFHSSASPCFAPGGDTIWVRGTEDWSRDHAWHKADAGRIDILRRELIRLGARPVHSEFLGNDWLEIEIRDGRWRVTRQQQRGEVFNQHPVIRKTKLLSHHYPEVLSNILFVRGSRTDRDSEWQLLKSGPEKLLRERMDLFVYEWGRREELRDSRKTRDRLVEAALEAAREAGFRGLVQWMLTTPAAEMFTEIARHLHSKGHRLVEIGQ